MESENSDIPSDFVAWLTVKAISSAITTIPTGRPTNDPTPVFRGPRTRPAT